MVRTKLPAETALGQALLPKGNTNKDLLEFIITNKNNGYFTYEFRYDNSFTPVWITGTSAEKVLPFIKFPLALTSNDITYLISNVTGSVKSDTSGSIIKSKRNDNVDFEVVRNVTMYCTLAEKDINTLMTICASVATLWLTRTLRNQFRLDIFSEGDVEGAIFNYFIKSYIPDIKEDNVKVKMLNYLSLSYKNNIGNTERVLGLLKDVEGDIGTYIRAVCKEHAILQRIESKAIYAMVGNHWYSGSDNSGIQIQLAMENFHTMCGILYHSINTNTGGKTILGKLLKDNKKSVKSDQLVDIVDGLIRDYTFM